MALCEMDALGNWLTVKTTLLPLCHLVTTAANTTTTVFHWAFLSQLITLLPLCSLYPCAILSQFNPLWTHFPLLLKPQMTMRHRITHHCCDLRRSIGEEIVAHLKDLWSVYYSFGICQSCWTKYFTIHLSFEGWNYLVISITAWNFVWKICVSALHFFGLRN